MKTVCEAETVSALKVPALKRGWQGRAVFSLEGSQLFFRG